MRQVCEKEVLPVLVNLLRDEDVEVQANAAGVIMYAAITNEGTNSHLDAFLSQQIPNSRFYQIHVQTSSLNYYNFVLGVLFCL